MFALESPTKSSSNRELCIWSRPCTRLPSLFHTHQLSAQYCVFRDGCIHQAADFSLTCNRKSPNQALPGHSRDHRKPETSHCVTGCPIELENPMRPKPYHEYTGQCSFETSRHNARRREMRLDADTLPRWGFPCTSVEPSKKVR